MESLGKDSFSGGFLVYINGVRVPAHSASVSVQLDTPASASIQVPAHPILYGLGDEDLLDIAIFYLDSYHYEEAKWCLLFEGRITGQGYSNTPSNESLYFTAESNMNALGDLYLRFLGKRGGKSVSNKSYPNQIDIKGKSYKSFLSESLAGRPLARPFDLIDNVYHSVLGSDVAGINSSISKQATKSSLDLVQKKLQALGSKFEAAARRSVGSPSDFSSDTDYKEQVNNEIRKLKEKWVRDHFGDPSSSNLDKEILRRLKEDIKARALKGSPTVTTGFFARYFRRIRSRNHWVCSPYLEGIPNSDNPIRAHIGGGVFPMFRATKTKRYAKSIAKNSGAKYGPGGSALSVVRNIFNLYFYRMSEILAPPAYTVDKYGLPKDKFYSKGDSNDYFSWSKGLTKTGDRLCIASYLSHPSTPFAVPPACNAIFPSMRTSFNVNNSYSSKPTRLYFEKRSPYGRLDFSVNSSSYATDSSRVTFPSVVAGAAQRAAGKASEEIDLLVFPEEYYRGPRPTPGQMHPTYADIKKYASAGRFGTKDRGDPVIPVTSIYGMSPEEAISSLESVEKAHSKGISSYGLYFLLARKQFLERKYGAVSGDVSMMFNPYVICGFPCAILGGEKSGLHFYGEVVSVNHSLSSVGNSTTIQVGTLRSANSVLQGIVADRFDIDSYPQEPVEEVRDLLQVYEPANEYYTQVLKKDDIGTLSAEGLELAIEFNSKSEDLRELKDKRLRFQLTLETLHGTIEQSPDASQEALKDMDERIRTLSAEVGTLKDNPGVADTPLGLPAAFDLKSFLGWQSSDDPSNTQFIVTSPLDLERRERQGAPSSRISQPGYRTDKLVPLPETSRYFKSSTQAMKVVSRPVCTLEQYIDFYSCVDLDMSISSLEGRGRGCRLGERREHFSGAIYYDVIRQYIGGPGVEPGTSLSEKSSDLEGRLSRLQARLGSEALSEEDAASMRDKIQEIGTNSLELSGIGPEGYKVFTTLTPDDKIKHVDLPDSRKDWQKLLLDYLTIVESDKPVVSEG